MIRVKRFSLLRWISMALIISAVLLLVVELITFSRLRSGFALGTTIGNVPVGGLSLDEAADRLTQAYSVPVELHYDDSVIQAKPTTLGFTLDLNAMITAADQERSSSPFWSAFWNYLFNRFPSSQDIPLVATIDETILRDYLQNEIAARYDYAAEPYSPVGGSVNFIPGKPGTQLNIERSVQLVGIALRSPTSRVVNLTVDKVASSKPSFDNLKILMQQIIDSSGFTGVTEIYLLDLQTRQELQLAYQQGKVLQPGIAFSAASTNKIPVMISSYHRATKPVSQDFSDLMSEMITKSSNEAPDSLMKLLIDPNIGPLGVSDDMEALGLKDTFLGGMFYLHAPLLKAFQTPANTRTDVNTSPDTYSQTTPAEMGSLLDDIYQCAQTGGGTFAAVFPGQISQSDCKSMISYLTQDEQAGLFREGLPDGTQIAHKHGWLDDETTQTIDLMADAGIVFTPGGNYILTMYIASDSQILYPTGDSLYINISRSVYNYFNLTSQ
jgi:beta-lactamase class A